MNINSSLNALAQTAVNNYLSTASMRASGSMNAISSTAQMLQPMVTQSSFVSAYSSFASSFGMGGFSSAGFLASPLGNFAQMPSLFGAQMMGALGGMNAGWNRLGNTLAQSFVQNNGMMNPQMAQLSNMMQTMAKMMNMLSALMQLSKQVGNKMNPGVAGKAQMPGLNGGVGGLKHDMSTAKFPGLVGDSYLKTLPTNRHTLARMFGIGGRRDEKRFQQGVNLLKTAKPKISLGKGTKGAGKLQLSAADVTAIRNAPDQKTAEKLVLKAISKQTGIPISELDPKNKRAFHSSKARKAINKLLGTRVRNGYEKNAGSSLVLKTIAESVAKSLRKGSFGSTTVQSPGMTGMMMMGGYTSAMGATGMAQMPGGGFMTPVPGAETNNVWGGLSTMGMAGGMIWHVPGQTQTIPNPASDVTIDLTDFRTPANKMGEMASPLIFDLEGTGLQLKNGGMIEIDIDGDGKKELITDLDPELGLLVFDSKDEGLADISGADIFGDNTDLSHYGIEADTQDGSFKDGFQALRALCEHYNLVNESKQFLDVGDLGFLEEEVGLRMRVGGVVSGDDRRFAEVGITEINLGNPAQTQHLEDAPEDRWGNKIMHQDGATFTVYGEIRKYADIWFKVQARFHDDIEANEKLDPINSVALLSRR